MQIRLWFIFLQDIQSLVIKHKLTYIVVSLMPFMSRPLVVLIDTPDWTWLCFLNMSFVFMLFVLTFYFVHFLQGYIYIHIYKLSVVK